MVNPENVPSLISLPPDARPFCIYIRHCDKRRDGTWRPEAFVGFSRSLRVSGLLTALPAEELKSLLYLLSFITPNGYVGPSILQLAEAFHMSQLKTRRRMERLEQIRWQDQPLVYYRRFESGLDAFMPHSGLFSVLEEQSDPNEHNLAPSYRAAPREAVIAHSRQTYARPRAEVEAIVARQLRPVSENPMWEKPLLRKSLLEKKDVSKGLNAEQQHIMQQLQLLGLNEEQAVSLVTRYELSRIQQQIDWLPYRRVHNPTGFLIAAIQHNYGAPRDLPPLIAADTSPHSSKPVEPTEASASASGDMNSGVVV